VIADSAVMLAEQIHAAAIVVETTTGKMARNIATHRPNIPVLAVSRDLRVANQMALLYNTLGFTGEGDDSGWTTIEKIREAGFFGDSGELLKFVVVRRVPSDSGNQNIANTIQLRELR
jgi:pyruvate kinase